ncbi:MAG: flagellar export protein FliJ [Plesiomonas sp.]|uniref:flagellar export protein FliJ n=1 Tax=Plesiomonas sp. TaxID=2486279 RepID=UPI003F3FE529
MTTAREYRQRMVGQSVLGWVFQEWSCVMSHQHGVLHAWYQQQQQQFEQLQSEQGHWQRQQQAHAERLVLLQQVSTQYALSHGNDSSALLVKGIGRFRNQLSLITQLQQQELALAEAELRTAHERVLHQHLNLKKGDTLLQKLQQQQQQREAKHEQRVLDELSGQRFLRRQQGCR